MKAAYKPSIPVLSGSKLEFFYSILTLWESDDENKVVKDFKSSEIKRFLARKNSQGKRILFITPDSNRYDDSCTYRLFVDAGKYGQAKSILYHLRNAFAHNDISLSHKGSIIEIEHTWQGKLKLKTSIPFNVLKELVETIRGEHNLTPEEKKKKPTKTKKSK